MNENLDLDLEAENSETLGGFLLEKLGEIPEADLAEYPVIIVDNLNFRIEAVSDRRIEKVRLTITPAKEETEEE